jgi:hypothetical protein
MSIPSEIREIESYIIKENRELIYTYSTESASTIDLL